MSFLPALFILIKNCSPLPKYSVYISRFLLLSRENINIHLWQIYENLMLRIQRSDDCAPYKYFIKSIEYI